MPQHVIVTESNPRWKQMFEEEAGTIRSISGSNCAVHILALRHPYDIEKYCDGKDDFAKRLEGLALEWRHSQ